MKTMHRQGSPLKNKDLKHTKFRNCEKKKKLAIFLPLGGELKVVVPELRHTMKNLL